MTMLADLQSHIAEAIRQAQGFRSVAVILRTRAPLTQP